MITVSPTKKSAISFAIARNPRSAKECDRSIYDVSRGIPLWLKGH
ncbi:MULTISPECIES: hypothetical protein [Cyanophyceae]|nr:hypothetical protein [Trichocoleus sp. FACHB-40]